MRRPSFQFYPADWRSNAKLRRCSRAERGDWIELVCLLHDSEEYGVLRWPLKDIAKAIGCQANDLRKGLIAKGVLKGADAGERCETFVYTSRHSGKDGPPVTLIPTHVGPIWYSSRMVRDEYIRNNRASQPEPIPVPKGGIGADLSRARAPPPAQSSSPSTSPSGENLKPIVGLAPDDARSGRKDAKEGPKRQQAREAAVRAINYLNAKAGTSFRGVKANLKLPMARILYDGATEADLLAVVDLKVTEAVRDDFDRKYLRPATLWHAEKFSQYIGQVGAQPPAAEKLDGLVQVYGETEDGKRHAVGEYPHGNAEEIARRAFSDVGSVPWMRNTRNLIVHVNGTASRFSLEELRHAA